MPYTPHWRDEANFGINVKESELDELTGTRRLVIEMRHHKVIWTGKFWDLNCMTG